MDAVDAARTYVDQRFPECLAAFMAGSVIRGGATATSDLDIVVVTTRDDAPFRESVRKNGWPIEAFVHTLESLRHYFAMDAESRTPSLPTMCLEGIVLRDRGPAKQMKAEAAALLERGPTPLTEAEIAARRYAVTDLLDDLLGCEEADEGLFIAGLLATRVTDFVLAYHNEWTGAGKWTLRALARFDPEAAHQLTEALQTYFCHGSKDKLAQFVDEALEPAGGRLFEGYRAGGTSD